MNFSLAFLRSLPAALVTVILAIEGALFYAAPTAEFVPNPPPLRSFQSDIGSWKMLREFEVDAETQSYLKADDTLSRSYAGGSGVLTLFVGFFKSQRGGVTPHSPKICLPGSGWTPEGSRIISVDVPGVAAPLSVNRYIVRHGEDRSLVLYWYVTAHYTMADEYYSKIVLMKEGLLHRRSDEAIFRVISPILGADEAPSEARAIAFIRDFYPSLKQQIWPN